MALLRFRAKHDMSMAEAERRHNAAMAAVERLPKAELPPSPIAERLAAADKFADKPAPAGEAGCERSPVLFALPPEERGPALAEALLTLAEDAPAPLAPEPGTFVEDRPRRQPDNPVVTVTISGPPGSGKSTIAHVIRYALAYEGVVTDGPTRLRSLDWRRALRGLRERGLKVELDKAEDAEDAS